MALHFSVGEVVESTAGHVWAELAVPERLRRLSVTTTVVPVGTVDPRADSKAAEAVSVAETMQMESETEQAELALLSPVVVEGVVGLRKASAAVVDMVQRYLATLKFHRTICTPSHKNITHPSSCPPQQRSFT